VRQAAGARLVGVVVAGHRPWEAEEEHHPSEVGEERLEMEEVVRKKRAHPGISSRLPTSFQS